MDAQINKAGLGFDDHAVRAALALTEGQHDAHKADLISL